MGVQGHLGLPDRVTCESTRLVLAHLVPCPRQQSGTSPRPDGQAKSDSFYCHPQLEYIPINELNRRAEIKLDPRYSISKYVLSSQSMLQQAKTYAEEGNLNNAYILYLRYTTLLLRELPQHPDYKKERSKKYLSHMKKCCRVALDKLEPMKTQLEGRYALAKRAAVEAETRQKVSAKEVSTEAIPSVSIITNSTTPPSVPPPPPFPPTQPTSVGSTPGESGLSEALDSLKFSTTHLQNSRGYSGATLKDSQASLHHYPDLTQGRSPRPYTTYYQPHEGTSVNVVQPHVVAARPTVNQPTAPPTIPQRAQFEGTSSVGTASASSSSYPAFPQSPPSMSQPSYTVISPDASQTSLHTPSQSGSYKVPPQGPFQTEYTTNHPDYHARLRQLYAPAANQKPGFFYHTSMEYDYQRRAPYVPPKPSGMAYESPHEDYASSEHVGTTHSSPREPVLPPKPLGIEYRRPSSVSVVSPAEFSNSFPKSHSQRSVQDGSRFQYTVPGSSRATTESGEPLRKIHVPFDLLGKFLFKARKNTERNLETCGILCGYLSHDEFYLTTLLIPKQTATSDTCTTTNEEEIVEYQIEKDLITLGWIHTHPTQTCFMSSLDIHTHFSYQQMLPEAIAIVCAPQHSPSYGIFRLTDPPGMKIINTCRDKRPFHPHENTDIYTKAAEPDHISIEHFDFTMVDMR
ncbi:hypothetical protein IWQ61_004776 [Dispira simplex]|nr:hypothetical protein IWQ61_004776 [Dispira simplex]